MSARYRQSLHSKRGRCLKRWSQVCNWRACTPPRYLNGMDLIMPMEHGQNWKAISPEHWPHYFVISCGCAAGYQGGNIATEIAQISLASIQMANNVNAMTLQDNPSAAINETRELQATLLALSHTAATCAAQQQMAMQLSSSNMCVLLVLKINLI